MHRQGETVTEKLPLRHWNQTFNTIFTAPKSATGVEPYSMKLADERACAGGGGHNPSGRNVKDLNLKLGLEICANDGVTVVYCRGRIAYREEAAALSGAMADLLPQSRHVVLELSAVETIDGAGLGELVVILMWARASQCSIKLAAPSEHIRRVLELANLDSVFEIYPSLDDATSACRRQVA